MTDHDENTETLSDDHTVAQAWAAIDAQTQKIMARYFMTQRPDDAPSPDAKRHAQAVWIVRGLIDALDRDDPNPPAAGPSGSYGVGYKIGYELLDKLNEQDLP